jgi:hypothetical protein
VSTIKVDTVQSTGGGAATLTKQEAAKSQVQFNGVTNTINGSLNIASMTDHATSDQAVTFTNSMANTNYCAESDTVSESDETDPRDTSINLSRTFSSSTYAIIAKYDASNADDRTKMFGVVHGDLA